MDDAAKGLLGIVEKWGNEHWSAATQKVNLDLLRDRLKIVDEEKKGLLRRAEDAEGELAVAKESLRQLNLRNKELERQLAASQPTKETFEPDEIDVSILSGFPAVVEPIEYQTIVDAYPNLRPQRVEYHLERLSAAGFLDKGICLNGCKYRLTQAGRVWLIAANMM